ncbi:DegT/DnrJ/EryC1/StrS family aminotransferase [Candidatus Pacearchaeota archaeon]|nr:DegT/DnrJ/EryC1/StrS family aminotransferase [Candidatus Pacearchaeota archaeon]
MDEGKIRNSFKSIKRDMEELKDGIKEIADKLSYKETTYDDSGKIFTSKVTVTPEMREAVNEVFDSGIFTSGEKVKLFERKFAEYCGIKHAIAVNNGTVAIELVLRSLGIGKGDEVIVPSHTTMPTVEPVLQVGAKPIFVDISEETFIIDPKEIRKKITKKTKAIIVVHLYGNVADLNELTKICEENKIFLIEDCAQAQGSRYNGKHVGTFGIAGCFSFYPTKNLTVCGEGGMVITNNDEIAKKVRMISSHGEEGRYNHVILGGNYRLSEIHSAIGIKQLELLEDFIDRRREIAQLYNELLGNIKGIILPKENTNSKHSYHLYVIRVSSKIRNKIIEKLREGNIFLGIHYPTPVHQQPVIKKYSSNSVKSKLKITEKISKEIISLPIYPTLEDKDVEMIASKIKELVINS